MNNNQLAMNYIMAKKQITTKDAKDLYVNLSVRSREIAMKLMATFEVGSSSSFNDVDYLNDCSEILSICTINVYSYYANNGGWLHEDGGYVEKNETERIFDEVKSLNEKLNTIVRDKLRKHAVA